MAIDPGTAGGIGGAVFVISNVAVFWYREWRKHRTWRENGEDMKEIKADMKLVKEEQANTAVELGKMGEIVKSQEKQCATTVARFDNVISKQQAELLKMAREK